MLTARLSLQESRKVLLKSQNLVPPLSILQSVSHQRPLWLLTKRKRTVLFTVGLPALSFRSIKHGMEPCSFARAMLFCINRGHPSEMSQAGSQWRLYSQFTIGICCEIHAENALTDLEHANTHYTWSGSPVKSLSWGTEEQKIHKHGGRNDGKQVGLYSHFKMETSDQ